MVSLAQAFETGTGAGGLAWVKLVHPSGSTATVHLFGATVVLFGLGAWAQDALVTQ